MAVHDRVCLRPCTRYSALLAQASQHLGLVGCNDVYREFTCVHHTIHPAPSPLDARRDTVPSRFGCQSGDCGSRVRRRCTGRYLPAHLRRILLMEQQVWSLQRARRSTVRPRVAADNQPCDLVSQLPLNPVECGINSVSSQLLYWISSIVHALLKTKTLQFASNKLNHAV